MMVERCVAHSLYIDASGAIRDVVVIDKPPIRFYDPDFPYEGRLERIDYRVIAQNHMEVKIGLFGGLHPPEHMVADIARRVFVKEDSLPRVEAWNVHILGAVFGERRSYIRPPASDEKVWMIPKRNRIYLFEGKRVKRGENIARVAEKELSGVVDTGENTEESKAVLGVRVDLNRQFHIPYTAYSWEEVFDGVQYPEARLLLLMMQKFPHMRYIFSFHEDMENGHNFLHIPGAKRLERDGVYWYDMCPDARTDNDKGVIEQLRWQLGNALVAAGYPLFHGVDDVTDPSLGFFADHGYIYQPVVNEDGAWYLDGTFESGVVDLGRRGLLGIERGFSFEIPGRYPRVHKERVVHIIKNQFIMPFLRAKGI